jgi:DNA polymerase
VADRDALAVVRGEASGCMLCRLSSSRTQVVFSSGSPDAALMIVGEGPGAQEDLLGVPFVGRSGQLLDRLLAEEVGLARDECYVANVVKCRPPENRNPRADEIAACRPYLDRQIDVVGPKVIVTLGNVASKALLGTDVGITRLRGSTYAYRGAILIPTFHPAAVLRGGAGPMAKMRADLAEAKLALSHRGTRHR